MKRIIIAAAALILAASCSKQDQDIVSENDIIVATGKPFTAVIEQETTRTVLTADYKVNWESGDRISINGAEYSATPDESDATKADFTYVSGADPEPTYKAVFPASLYNAGTLELPAVQTYAAGKFNAPMYAESETENLSFKNICGVICLALKGTESVKTITITANEPVCGAFTMTDANTVSLSGTGRAVTLQCGETGVALNETTATKFYIYLPPRTYSAGMNFTVTSTGGGVYEKTTGKAVTIERSNIYTFNWTAKFTPEPPTTALSGVFSVAPGVQVHFAKGNIYASLMGMGVGTIKMWSWDLYAQQYASNSLNSGASRTASDNDSEIDLFTWGYNNKKSVVPTGADSDNVSITSGTLSSSQSWKVSGWTTDESSLWRTPTIEEWQYLFEGRANASNLYKCGVTVCGKANCVVIAPDGWNTAVNPLQDSYSDTSTPMTWAQAQSAGLVCLPAAGIRNGASVSYVGSSGYYWSSTASDADNAGYLSFTDSGISISDDGPRGSGRSVRLVREASVVPVESVSLDKSEMSIKVGETLTLTATVLPADATNKNVAWSSSNYAVANVDGTGKVTGVSGGIAVITATTVSGKKTATCIVSVSVPVESVSLDKTKLNIGLNDKATLIATILPANASNKNVNWSSSNTAVATVDETGKVTGVSEGIAVITATTVNGNKTATCTFNVIPGVVYLGLSVSWATCNLGASYPWEYGGYYQWAGTEDVTDTSIDLNWDNCPYHNGSDYTTGWTKYVRTSNSSYWSGAGNPDGKTVLDPADDAAHVILGGDWRMPTDTEWRELFYNCTWEWTDNYNGKGVAGYKVTSNKEGYKGKAIFLPAAGYRNGTSLDLAGSGGYYWSGSLDESYSYYARYFFFFASGSRSTYYNYRCSGRSVRPVLQ